jgi:hypothetical protein
MPAVKCVLFFRLQREALNRPQNTDSALFCEVFDNFVGEEVRGPGLVGADQNGLAWWLMRRSLRPLTARAPDPVNSGDTTTALGTNS